MLAKLRKAWPEVMGDDQLLSGLLRDVGYACASLDVDALREIRNFIASATVEGEKREGMLVAAVELLDGHRDYRVAQLEDTRIELGLRSSLHVKILRLLQDGRSTPTTIASSLPSKAGDVSAALNKLRSLDLVDEPVRDELDKRVRYYRLTPRARDALARLQPGLEPRMRSASTEPAAARVPHHSFDSSEPIEPRIPKEEVAALPFATPTPSASALLRERETPSQVP